jgi:hypothetical protein
MVNSHKILSKIDKYSQISIKSIYKSKTLLPLKNEITN